MKVLEDRSIESGRLLALRDISTRMYWGLSTLPQDKSLPPVESVMTRLNEIANDETESYFLRSMILPVLFKHDDPNLYLDLAIKLADRKPFPGDRAQAFCFSMPVVQWEKFSEANKIEYLEYTYPLLKEINDGKTVSGYFLALHIGAILGVEPVDSLHGQGSFAPDQRLPQYQGKNGLSDSFFQATVDNALAWWKENRRLYSSEQGVPPDADDRHR